MDDKASAVFDVTDKNTDPINLFKKWYDTAQEAGVVNADSMMVATVKSDATLSARIVSLQGFDEKGFRFSTNYNSVKAKELELNPNVALVFFWNLIQRSVRVEGTVEKFSDEESDNCFNKLPPSLKFGVHVGENQSSVIASREMLVKRVATLTQELAGKEITRPSFLGGYTVKPHRFEFWKGQKDWMTDRILFIKKSGLPGWTIQRLEP
uniref:uncharacterized protein LOC100184029 n=1 Tax=Ciona intestinalis TaxID=7719 RepID=UPI000180BC64|nr:uncharacterized protein LOC100184029 [Ciona intestinalis]|eukprot:XP_004226583.1 uncharacterized protein LOC100184029 [Ciona intestinalis]